MYLASVIMQLNIGPKRYPGYKFREFCLLRNLCLLFLFELYRGHLINGHIIDLLENKHSIRKLAVTKTWSLEKQLTSQEQLHRSFTYIVNSIQKNW